MPLQPEKTATRRTLLSGGIGGLGAWLAAAITRPQPALAATDTAAVHKGVNNPTTALTTITCSGATALKVASPSGGSNRSALFATASGTSSRGVTALGVTGVIGQSGATGGRGVFGLSTATSGTPAGVLGKSSAPGGRAVQGENVATTGLAIGTSGTSKSGVGIGVLGANLVTNSPDTYGVYGEAYGTGVGGDHLGTGVGAGVLGTSNSPGGTGVRGVNTADDGDAYGVYGSTICPDGNAIRAQHDATSGGGTALKAVTNAPFGIAVAAFANDGTAIHAFVDPAGTALQTHGQVKFSSAGMATVPAGASEVTVSPDVRIPATAKILCTVNSAQAVGVLNVERLSNTQFKIVLTAEAVSSCNVAYFVMR